MLKRIVLVLIVLGLIVGCAEAPEVKEPEKVLVEYFFSKTCESCMEVEANVTKTLEDHKDIIKVVKYEAPIIPDLNSEFGKKVIEYKIQVTPSYAINKTTYQGYQEIKNLGKNIRMAYSKEVWKVSEKEYYLEYFYMEDCAFCEKSKEIISKLESNPRVHLVRYDIDTTYGEDHLKDYGLNPMAPVLVFNTGLKGKAVGYNSIVAHETVKEILGE